MSNQLAAKPFRFSIVLTAVTLVSVAVLALGVYFASPGSAEANSPVAFTNINRQAETTSTTLAELGQGGDIGILPRPNSGSAPTSSNQRGGWEQYAVMAAIVLSLAAILLLIRRESKRSKVVFDQRHRND